MILSAPALFASNKEPNPWLQVHSTHFTVITDAGDKKGKEVALRFEQMRAVFAGLFSKDHLNQPLPLTILAFKDEQSYYRLAPLMHVSGKTEGMPINVPGFFLPGGDQDFIALNLSQGESWRAVASDFAHMLLEYNYPPVQRWFDEGMDEYFGSIRVDNTQVQIGGDPELIAAAIQNQTASTGNAPETHAAKSFTELLETENWIPIPDLFTMEQEVPQAKESSTDETARSSLYKAESWMVVHYLIHEKRLPDTGAYFGAVMLQHLPADEAIEKAYGVTTLQFERAVKDYFHSLAALQTEVDTSRSNSANAAITPEPYQYPALVKPDDSTITADPYPEADARALYAEIQIRIPDRRDQGLLALHNLATTPTPAEIRMEAANEKREKQSNKDDSDPDTLPTNAVGNALAHRVLAWDHIEHGEFDDALAELGDAATLNQRDMWVRYYLCVLKFRMAQARHTDISGLANMLIDLRAVLEWYPEMSDAYDLLAMARIEGGTFPAALESERAAMNLRPRDQNYDYHLAEIYISGKKWDAAQALLQRLKQSSDAHIAQLAQKRLDEIAGQRRYGMAVAGAAQAQLAPQKTPFDVLDEDAAKRAAAEKQEDSSERADSRPTKFLKGRLIAVDCSQSPAAILTIATEGVLLKLRASDYKSLLLIGADDFSCDWRNRQVSVNYKSGGLSDGDLVSLEIR